MQLMDTFFTSSLIKARKRTTSMSGRCLAVFLPLAMTAILSAHAQTVEYYHTDALGTPVAVTDATGEVIRRNEYAPYGDLLNEPATDGPGYTGNVTDAATGLDRKSTRLNSSH